MAYAIVAVHFLGGAPFLHAARGEKKKKKGGGLPIVYARSAQYRAEMSSKTGKKGKKGGREEKGSRAFYES